MDDPPSSLTYFDSRYCETYQVSLDENGAFVSALRYTDTSRPPIFYSFLGDIPQPHRDAIITKILKCNASSS